MGIWDKIKRTVQRIVPGGKTGNEPAKRDAGTISLPSAGNNSPSENIAKGASSSSTRKAGAADPTDTTELGKKYSSADRVLDIVSAPLSQAKTTFTKGINAGADAVRDSRAKISAGDNMEAAKVIGKTVINTATVASAVLGVGALTSAARATVTTGATSSQIALKAAELGVSKKLLADEVRRITINQAAKKLAEVQAKKVFIGLTKKQLLWTLGGLGSATVTGTLGVSGAGSMTTWIASDNMVGVAGVTINKIETRYQAGQITKADAMEQIDGQIDIIKKAQETINAATLASIFMYPFRTVYQDNAQNVLNNAEITRDLLSTLPETEAAMYERLREESDARDAAYEEMRTQDKLEEDADAEEWQRNFEERVTLDEAIRKRNAGIELTEEEWAVLIKYGLDTKVVSNWDDNDYGKSNLGFGGLF